MVDLHAREPLKRRGRNVIIVPDAEDGRVGVEAREDGVADGRHGDGSLGKFRETGEKVSEDLFETSPRFSVKSRHVCLGGTDHREYIYRVASSRQGRGGRELMHAVLFSRFNRRVCHCSRPYRRGGTEPFG